MRDIITRLFHRPVGRALILSFIAIILNVVAAQIKVSTPWLLTLLVLALMGSIVMEASKVDKESKRASFNIEPPASWLQLSVWALLSTLFGVVVSFIALLIPLPHTQHAFPLIGGLSGRAVEWYWYDVLSAAAISALALIIGLRVRSIAKLILFVLFSTTGMTLVIAAFEYETSIYVTYVPTALFALVLGILMFSRDIIAGQFREIWGHSDPVRHNHHSRAKADAGMEEDSRVRETREEDNKR